MSTSIGPRVPRLKITQCYSPEIKGLYGDFDFAKDWGYETKDPNSALFHLFMDIQFDDNESVDSFVCLICTPQTENKLKGNIKKIVMENYTFRELKSIILANIKECESDNLDECIRRLRNYFSWEYD